MLLLPLPARRYRAPAPHEGPAPHGALHHVSITRHHLRNRLMEDGGRNGSVVPASRSVDEIRESVMPMMGIDPGGKTGRLPHKTGNREVPVGIFHRLREFDVRIAGCFGHIENHVVAPGFEPFQPCRIGLGLRKGTRRRDPPDERDRQMRGPRGCEQDFTVSQHGFRRGRGRLARLMKSGQNKNRLFAWTFVTAELDDGHLGATFQQRAG